MDFRLKWFILFYFSLSNLCVLSIIAFCSALLASGILNYLLTFQLMLYIEQMS